MLLSRQPANMEEKASSLCIKCGGYPVVDYCFYCQKCIDEEEREKFIEENAHE